MRLTINIKTVFKNCIIAFTCLVLTILLSPPVFAQQNVHPQSAKYEWPTDAKVKAKLDKWQDQKFGMIIHWGLYAVPGIIESWELMFGRLDKPAGQHGGL